MEETRFEIAPEASPWNEYDVLLKFVIIGDLGCGKSCLLNRYKTDRFHANYISTIGVDFETKTVRLGTTIAKLQIWDTAGQERFRSITNSYYQGAHAIMVVYDITSRSSFRSVPGWVQDARKYGSNTVQIVLVGNKLDLAFSSARPRTVSEAEGRSLAKQLDCTFVETSAHSAENVERAFHDLALDRMKRRWLKEVHRPSDARTIIIPVAPSRRSCCAFW